MKIKHLGTLLAIISIFICLIQPVMASEQATNFDEATANYNLGERAIADGNLQMALVYFNTALSSNTTMVRKSGVLLYIYSDKAGVLADLGRYDEAIQTADEGLVIDNNYTKLWNNKGFALLKLGRYQDAIKTYDEALKIDRNYTKAWNGKGDALYQAGRYQEAVDAYNQALATDLGNMYATAGLTLAQKDAASANMRTMIVLVVILIAIAGIAIYYFKIKKPAEKKK